ncbi:hypothetical protein JCM4814A_74150 [Streptomyces phaeofaciens JCM 4814]|uniref:Uncharacterized protein n=1 Tax=Streptomyces phaeofaciens TaxID=68254 RepID=A0A918HH08_9ACTN|nr:hypothetical protein [Streptomyces phaeofaciens]GGT63640.1 hypothetical protein GCM10010226_46610 [Streptomyces phaeofaciens]
MRLVRDRGFGEVDLTASADELGALARSVAEGEGLLGCASPAGADEPAGVEALAGVEVRKSPGPGVHIRLDRARQILVISGDAASRGVLADNLRDMAEAEDGGHLHVDHFPDHPYLAEGSVPLVVNSPHGGMPAR